MVRICLYPVRSIQNETLILKDFPALKILNLKNFQQKDKLKD